MRLSKTYLVVSFVLTLIISALAFARVPQTINYQGYLTHGSGSPINTTTGLTFSLYSTTNGAQAVWNSGVTNVTPQNGIYTIQLGESPQPSLPFFDRPYWLGVQAGSDPEMRPLQPLSSVPYALRASVADSAGTSSITAIMIADGTITSAKLSNPLGIGTLTPEYNLDVNGTGRFIKNLDVASGTSQIGFNRNSTNGGIYDKTSKAWQIGPIANQQSRFVFSSWSSNGVHLKDPLVLSTDGNVSVSGTLSAGGLAPDTVKTAAIMDRSVTASKIGAVCADGELLRYDSQTGAWRCNPAIGGFPALPPPVGALTISNLTSPTINPAGPDRFSDILVYGFDIKFNNPSSLYGGSLPTFTLDPVKIVCDPKQFTRNMNLGIAIGRIFDSVGLWLPGSNGSYKNYISFSRVSLISQKPVPPIRKGDPTLQEYTFIPETVSFTSPSNVEQTVTINTSGGLTKCNHLNPIFTVTHELTVAMNQSAYFAGLLPTTGATFKIYPITSYSSGISSTPVRAAFDNVTVSGPLGEDGPCFMSDIGGSRYSDMFVTAAALESEKTGAPILESQLRLQPASMASYRLYADKSTSIQQEMSFTFAKIYWGYHPLNLSTLTNDPIAEAGWDLELNQQTP